MCPSSHKQGQLCWQGIWYGSTKINLIFHAHNSSKVKVSSGEALSDSQASSNADLEKSVDSNSPGRSWVWFPSTHDLKTHYVRILGTLISLFGSDSEPCCTSRENSLYRRIFRAEMPSWSSNADFKFFDSVARTGFPCVACSIMRSVSDTEAAICR